MHKYTADDTPESLSREQLKLMANSDSSLLLYHLESTTSYDVHRVRLLLELGVREAKRLADQAPETQNAKVKEPWEICRAAFVKIIREENFYRDVGRWSVKQHWAGPKDGFADEQLQRRWNDFKLGWETSTKTGSNKTG